jgi:hypothetical protein
MLTIPSADGNIQFAAEAAPTSGLGVRTCWDLGSRETLATAQRLQKSAPTDTEMELITRICERDIPNEVQILNIVGRSLTFKSPLLTQVSRYNVKYDAIEISGWGTQNFHQDEDHLGLAMVNYNEPIRLPSSTNFYTGQKKGIGMTSYINNGQRETECPPECYSGAYTLNGAASKVAKALLISMLGQDILTPIPIMLGSYDHISGIGEDPAHFIAYRVPYSGKRTGQSIGGENILSHTQKIQKSLKSVAKATREMHDHGYTHNSLNPSNYYIDGLSQTAPAYVADLATTMPFSFKDHDAAAKISNDLSRPFYEFMCDIAAFKVSTTCDDLRKNMGDVLTGYLRELKGLNFMNIYGNKEIEIFASNAFIGFKLLLETVAKKYPSLTQDPYNKQRYIADQVTELTDTIMSTHRGE